MNYRIEQVNEFDNKYKNRRKIEYQSLIYPEINQKQKY